MVTPPKSHLREHQGLIQASFFPLCFSFLIPPLSHLFILLFKNISFLTSCCCFSLSHIPSCPLKGKPSCFAHPGSPSVPVVAVPGITTLLISFFLALQFLSRAVAGKQVYTNLPKLDKMNVQLFLFLAACFSLHQNCSCTCHGEAAQKRTFFFYHVEEATQGVLLIDPCWFLDKEMWEVVGRFRGLCFSPQSLHYPLVLPPGCFQVKEALPFCPNHLPWSHPTFCLLSLNGVCTIWTFSL